NSERIKSKIGDIILKPGDSLLLVAGTDFVEKQQHSDDFFVVSSLEKPTNLKQSTKKGWFSIILLLTMVVTVTMGWLSMFKAMALAVLVFFMTKMITPKEAKEKIPFNILLLIASSFGIGAAVKETGLAEWIATILLNFGKPWGLLVMLFMIYMLTNIFTEFVTNSAAAVIMLPIGMEVAQTLTVDPTGIAVLITIAASASF